MPNFKTKKNWKTRGSDTFSNLFNLRNTFLPFEIMFFSLVGKFTKVECDLKSFKIVSKIWEVSKVKYPDFGSAFFVFSFFYFSFIVLRKKKTKKNYPTPNQPTHNTKPPNHPTTRPGTQHLQPNTQNITTQPNHPTQSFFFRVLSFSLNFFVFFFS